MYKSKQFHEETPMKGDTRMKLMATGWSPYYIIPSNLYIISSVIDTSNHEHAQPSTHLATCS